MTDAVLYTAPGPSFAVDGQTVADLGRDLARLEVTEGAMGLRCLVAYVVAAGPEGGGTSSSWSYLDGSVVDLGSEITAAVGSSDERRQVFRGVVSSIEVSISEGGYPYVCLRAEDALMRLRMTSRSATWTDSSDGDLVRAIADKHGLSSIVDLDGPTNHVVQQLAESDLAFLRRRLTRINAELWIDADDVIHAADRTAREGPTIALVQGNELITVTARADLAHQRSTVVVRGWDRQRVEAAEGKADDDIVLSETIGRRTGPSVATNVFGDVDLARFDVDAIDARRASRLAAAEMTRRARGFVTVDGTTAGTPDLVPGAHLTLQRIGRPFEGGGYRAVHVCHRFDHAEGYRTDFTAERGEVSA